MVRVAPHLHVFSSSPSVSIRPKSLTGYAGIKPGVDIIVEISKTFLLWYPGFPLVFPPVQHAHILSSFDLAQ